MGDSAVAQAYGACEQIVRAHYENFPVASRLLPGSMRPHVAAVYAFARIADDIADEGVRPPAERQRLLDNWLERLHEAVETGPHDDPILIALAHTIGACNLPLSLFDDLISAFRQDTMTTRYATWRDVLDYCRRSANPVGRLVLRVAGYDDPERDRESDAFCTALQLANFWQDLAIDWRRGRLYVPAEEYEPCGARLDDLDAGRITPAWREALGGVATRTRTLFDEGRPVCDAVRGRLQYELRLTWLGGTRILDRLGAVGYDVFTKRPTLGARDALPIAWKFVRWRAQR
jgi:squalene synthase HpnC